MITSSVTVKTMRNICGICMKTHYVGTMTNYIRKNRGMDLPDAIYRKRALLTMKHTNEKFTKNERKKDNENFN